MWKGQTRGNPTESPEIRPMRLLLLEAGRVASAILARGRSCCIFPDAVPSHARRGPHDRSRYFRFGVILTLPPPAGLLRVASGGGRCFEIRVFRGEIPSGGNAREKSRWGER